MQYFKNETLFSSLKGQMVMDPGKQGYVFPIETATGGALGCLVLIAAILVLIRRNLELLERVGSNIVEFARITRGFFNATRDPPVADSIGNSLAASLRNLTDEKKDHREARPYDRTSNV